MTGHRSRLCAAYVDVPRDRYDAAVSFYGEMVGQPAQVDVDDPDYASYGPIGPGVELGVQAVGDPTPRVHLDIETDDVEAEVARLLTLGATVVDRIQTWVVMRDPVGIVFCVIKVQDAKVFEASAKRWN